MGEKVSFKVSSHVGKDNMGGSLCWGVSACVRAVGVRPAGEGVHTLPTRSGSRQGRGSVGEGLLSKRTVSFKRTEKKLGEDETCPRPISSDNSCDPSSGREEVCMCMCGEGRIHVAPNLAPPPTSTLVCDPLFSSVGTTCDLLLTSRRWQR